MGCVNSKNKTQSTTQLNDLRELDPINLPMIQNVVFIWLDANIDESSANYRNIINHIHDDVKTFTDSEQCIQFVEAIVGVTVCMIISGSLGQAVVPRIFNLPQINSIFIFCNNKIYHEGWAKDWSKIKGVFSEIEPLCQALKHATEESKQNIFPLSIMGVGNNSVDEREYRLESSFMYTQIMKEIFLSIDFGQRDFDEFITYCRKALDGNSKQLILVHELAQQYHQHTPIWWYTRECFLYPMINRALRVIDVDLMIKLGFFIKDFHNHIARLHQEQFGGQDSNQLIVVYRGQGMDEEAIVKLVENKGGFTSFNNFLSTSKSREVSLRFAQHVLRNPARVGVLMVMTIDPARSTTPFASVANVGYFGHAEDEVLFSMHTIFRIGDITSIDDNPRLMQVELTLIDDADPDLQKLTDHLRKEVCQHPNSWYQLSRLLRKTGQFDTAQHIYERLLSEISDLREQGYLYQQIGSIKTDQGKYFEAISYFEKALIICEKTLLPKHPRLASSYTQMGLAYRRINEHSKALKSHENALQIYQKIRPSDHLDLALTFNNIGLVYDEMKEYDKALTFHEKALDIRQKALPPNHPELAMSYNNIGLVYNNMKEYFIALSFHEKALVIRQQTLPADHPDLAMSYNNIGLVYNNVNEYDKALSYHEKALEIRERTLRADHPDLAMFYNNIASVYQNLEDYAKSIDLYERALQIGQGVLPPGHPDLELYKMNLDLVKQKA